MDVILGWISYFVMFIAGLVSRIFPPDPFKDSILGFTDSDLVSNGFAFLNWFLPFNSLSSTVALVLGCIVGLYVIKLIKWLIQFISEVVPG